MEKDAHVNHPLLGEDREKISTWASAVEVEFDPAEAHRVQWTRTSSSTHLWSWLAQFLLFGASLFMFSATAMWRAHPVEHCVKELSATCKCSTIFLRTCLTRISSRHWRH